MINVVVIEDDFIWKNKMLSTLDSLEIGVLGTASDISSAVELLNNHQPDLVIADIWLGKERIFNLYDSNPNFCKIPTIFVTKSDLDIDFKNAKKVSNHLYVVKPIHKFTLQSAIEKLCNKNQKKSSNEILNIRGSYNQNIELPFEKITHISQDQHYCTINTPTQQFTFKKSLANVMKDLDERFMQVHRSYCINKDFIENFAIGLETLRVKGIDIPIGFTFKDEIKKLISERYSVT